MLPTYRIFVSYFPMNFYWSICLSAYFFFFSGLVSLLLYGFFWYAGWLLFIVSGCRFLIYHLGVCFSSQPLCLLLRGPLPSEGGGAMLAGLYLSFWMQAGGWRFFGCRGLFILYLAIEGYVGGYACWLLFIALNAGGRAGLAFLLLYEFFRYTGWPLFIVLNAGSYLSFGDWCGSGLSFCYVIFACSTICDLLWPGLCVPCLSAV